MKKFGIFRNDSTMPLVIIKAQMKWGTFKKGLQIHIAPADKEGFTNHDLNPDCYCCPRFTDRDSITGKELYVHNEAS